MKEEVEDADPAGDDADDTDPDADTAPDTPERPADTVAAMDAVNQELRAELDAARQSYRSERATREDVEDALHRLRSNIHSLLSRVRRSRCGIASHHHCHPIPNRHQSHCHQSHRRLIQMIRHPTHRSLIPSHHPMSTPRSPLSIAAAGQRPVSL